MSDSSFDDYGDSGFGQNGVGEMSSSAASDGENGPEGNKKEESKDPSQYLGTLPLAMIVFYNVSGGPFGVEESVRSAGFFFTIIGFIIFPFVWSIPEAMMTAELGSAYPEASGGVAWVEEAFGPSVGWMAGFLGWVAGATDNAIYPVLFLDYVFDIWSTSSDEVHPVLRFVLLSCTSMLLGVLNWMGLEVVGRMSIIIGFLSLSPFICMTLVGIFKVDPQRWLKLPDGPNGDESNSSVVDFNSIWTAMVSGAILWRPFLNNLFWNLNSFDATASFAADVKDPGRTLPRSMMIAVLLIVSGYIFPILVATGATDSEQSDWIDGYLATAAEEVGGEWLGAWVIFAAGVANIALFQAELSADAFQLMGMAERGYIPKIFATRSRFGTPTYGILLGVGVIVAMGSFNLDKLIEMLNFNYSIALLLEYVAFIKLRISKPDVPRPFRMSLGTVGCIIYMFVPVSAVLLIMALASYTTMLFGFCMVCVALFLSHCRQASLGGRFCGCCSTRKAPVSQYEMVDANLSDRHDLPAPS